MKTAWIWLSLFASVPSAAGAAEYGFTPRPSCERPALSEPVLHTEDFKWGYSLPQMAQRFEEIYSSPKRLKNRAYYDSSRQRYVMEYEVYTENGPVQKPVSLPPQFIKSITRHIEIALERRYADFVFFPDMGHSHFYFPENLKDQLTDFPVSQFDRIYQNLVNEPRLKVLYHTAEQLEMARTEGEGKRLLDDRTLQWRYFTRNVIGDNSGGESTAPRFAWNNEFNTLSELEGHASWSSGFNLSANRDGCFPYQKDGKTYWFDLSWYDLEPMDGASD